MARPYSGSAEFLRTIIFATRWTRPTPRFCGPVSNASRRCWPSPPCGSLRPIGGRTLIAWDGTEYFCSQKLACPNCLTPKRSNGNTESYHSLLSATVVAPGHSKVIPLMPEFVATQDGAEKQDCERNAVKRWFSTHVNWIGFEIVDAKGNLKYSMAWVTSLPVSKDNVAEIVACGRARWKIENESFNVMKNHGYELEHNFGHGQKFLAMTLAALNLLAFAWHTVLELLDPPWQAARQAAAKRTSFFAHILTLTAYVVFPSWPVLLEALTNFAIPPRTPKNPRWPMSRKIPYLELLLQLSIIALVQGMRRKVLAQDARQPQPKGPHELGDLPPAPHRLPPPGTGDPPGMAAMIDSPRVFSEEPTAVTPRLGRKPAMAELPDKAARPVR